MARKKSIEHPAGDDEPPASVPGTPPPGIQPESRPPKPGVTTFFVHSAPDLNEPQRRPRVLSHKIDILRQIDAFFATLPPDAAYGEKVQQIEEFGHAVNRSIVAYLSVAIKTEFSRLPSSTYADKLASTRWLSGELRRFNIAIQAARVGGGVATLSADKDGLGGGGRFKLKAKTKPASGQPSNFNTPHLAELLAEIELVEAPRRREGLQKRRTKDDPPG